MIIVIGILVDDGIVIAENIYQHYEKGKTPIEAAIDGTLEVIPPVVSAIITTLLAFSLFLFLDSRIGEFFSEVAVIVILTLVVSLVEALIILPAHLAHSKALRKQVLEENPSKMKQFFARMRGINAFGDRIMSFLRDKVYAPVLDFVLQFKVLSLGIFVSLLVLTFGSIGGGIIGVTIFPSIASDTVSIELDMPNGTNEKITDSIISMIEEKSFIVNKEFTEKYLEGTGKELFENTILTLNSSSSARLVINLLPGEERPDEIVSSLVANRLRELVGPVVGTERLIFGSGGNFGGSPVSVALLGNNIEELKAAKQELKQVLSENPLLKDIEDNDPAGIKEIRLELKESAYLLGLDLRTVMSQVRSGFFGVQAQRFQRGQDEIRVWVRYDRSNRASINDLDDMRIVTPSGERVTLKDIADYTIERGDVAINHLEGQREIRISADLKDPSSSATYILDDIKKNTIPDLKSKYPTISASFEGQNREASKLSGSLAKAGIPILLLIYITIAFTFRSYSQPLLLILLVPFSLTAVAWGHWLLGFSVNVLSLLGIIALIGIMVNDGLVLIGKFNTNLKEGMKFDLAISEAGKSRFRAIFLTSLTTIAGLAPLLMEKSRQAQFLKPMAISISFGIAYATILTLLVLPLFLSFSNSFKKNAKWLWTNKNVTKEEVERAIKEQNEANEH
jgi:multidrug efflux pump subunit AcrB